MGDREMINRLARTAADARSAEARGHMLTVSIPAEELERLRTLAETGALLAEVERRWPEADGWATYIDNDNECGWLVDVIDGKHRVNSGKGPTLTAALRDLLGVGDG